MNIKNSKGVNKNNCNGINRSNGINGSDGISWSNSISWSNGISWSHGINGSNGINRSHGISWSHGINRSHGISWSYGVNRSHGINRSYGILNSQGVSRAIFLADKKQKPTIFGVEVSKERFENVWSELQVKLNGWYPNFNNTFELYIQAGNDWEKVKASDICPTLSTWEEPYEAWKDMPQKAIDYVRSLPEYDAKMFERITGIKEDDDVDVTVEGKTTRISRKSAIALGLIK